MPIENLEIRAGQDCPLHIRCIVQDEASGLESVHTLKTKHFCPAGESYWRYAATGRDALYHRRLRYGYLARFIGNYLQTPSNRLEKLAGEKQEVGVPRPPKTFVTLCEGFVDEKTARRHGVDQRWKQGAVQVVDHDDAAKHSAGQGKRGAVFEVVLQQLKAAFALQVGNSAQVSVDSDDRELHSVQQPEVAPAATGDINDFRLGLQQRQEAADPS